MENNAADINATSNFGNSLLNARDVLTAELALQKHYDELESYFLMKNYPPFCQRLHYYILKYLDSQDYNTSPIYDMYPSSATIDSMADIIYMEIKDDSPDILKEFKEDENSKYTTRSNLYMLIYPLLLNELYRRRMRKYIYTLCHYPSATF